MLPLFKNLSRELVETKANFIWPLGLQISAKSPMLPVKVALRVIYKLSYYCPRFIDFHWGITICIVEGPICLNFAVLSGCRKLLKPSEVKIDGQAECRGAPEDPPSRAKGIADSDGRLAKRCERNKPAIRA